MLALTIDLRGLSDLCIFNRPYSLGRGGFVGFNVNIARNDAFFY